MSHTNHRRQLVDGRIVPTDAARAVGRFRPDEPAGFVAAGGTAVRSTRREAEQDWLRALRTR